MHLRYSPLIISSKMAAFLHLQKLNSINDNPTKKFLDPAACSVPDISIQQRVRRAAQHRRLPGVGHNMREGAARAETRHGAALPALRLVGPGPPASANPGTLITPL